MRTLLTAVYFLAVASAAGATPAADSLFTPRPVLQSYARTIGADIAHVFTAPAHWQERQWEQFGQRASTVVGAVAVLDLKAKNIVRLNRSHFADELADRIEPFGRTYPYIVEGGFYLAGVILKKPNARLTARDAVAADVITVGLITPALKFLIGRKRPFQNDGEFSLDPFGRDPSFPSGHTAHAFMLAAVIDAHYRQTWVKVAVYSVATLVACARVYQNRHWSSDVIAGGFIGYSIGKSVVRLNRTRQTGTR